MYYTSKTPPSEGGVEDGQRGSAQDRRQQEIEGKDTREERNDEIPVSVCTLVPTAC